MRQLHFALIVVAGAILTGALIAAAWPGLFPPPAARACFVIAPQSPDVLPSLFGSREI